MHNRIIRIARWILVLCLSFFIGSTLQAKKDAHILASWRAGAPPAPELCALCGDGKGIWYHAPVLLDLATGQISELDIYPPHPTKIGEVTETSEESETRLMTFGGNFLLQSINAEAQSSITSCTLSTKDMDAGYYCMKCRDILSAAASEGFVLLDLHDLSDILAFPLVSGAEYSIHGYDVSISFINEKCQIEVKGKEGA